MRLPFSIEELIANAPLKPTASAAVRAIPAQADRLRIFRDVATVRRVDVARPHDTPLDRVAAAKAARAIGLTRIADRLV